MRKQPRHVLSIVKNSADVPVSGSHAAPVRRALTRMSTSVILDQNGCMRACGQHIAALAGLTRQTLNGKPIKFLLPTMPFQPTTPGYNVAFAVFHAGAGRRTVCKMKNGAGLPVMVDVSVTILETAPAYLFSLDIREHTRLAVLAPEAGATAQQQSMFQRCA